MLTNPNASPNDYYTHHVVPRPESPAPGWEVRMRNLQLALAAEALSGPEAIHGHVALSGRSYTDPDDGAVWYEAKQTDFPEAEAWVWVSWDVAPDPRAPQAQTATAVTGWQEADEFWLVTRSRGY